MAAQGINVSLEALKFFYFDKKTSLYSKAIPIHTVQSPEYPCSQSTMVAYPIGKIEPKETVLCCLRSNLEGVARQWITVVVTKIHADQIVPICTQSVCFVKGPFATLYPETGFLPFELDFLALLGNDLQVGIQSFVLNWQYRMGQNAVEGDLIDIGAFNLDVYLGLDEPSYPWGLQPAYGTFKPAYVAPMKVLMRHGIEWAVGCKDVVSTAAAITKGLVSDTSFVYDLNSHYTAYQYDPQSGAPVSPDINPVVHFNVGALREHLMGLEGNGSEANCFDMATTILLIANAIGCNLRVMILHNPNNPENGFALNPHKPLRLDPLTESSFTFHVVAFLPGNTEDPNMVTDTARVFDPCLTFTDSAGQPIFPIGMPFAQYKSLLAKNPSECEPLPFKNCYNYTFSVG